MKINTILSSLPKKRKKGYEQTRRSVQEEVLLAQSNLCTMCKAENPRGDRKGALRPQPANICMECRQPDKFNEVQVDTLPGGAGVQGLYQHGSLGAMYEKKIKSKDDKIIEVLPDVRAGDMLTKKQLWGKIPEEETFYIPEVFPDTFVVKDDEEEFNKVTIKGSEELQKEDS